LTILGPTRVAAIRWILPRFLAPRVETHVLDIVIAATSERLGESGARNSEESNHENSWFREIDLAHDLDISVQRFDEGVTEHTIHFGVLC